ncbi:SRPBCC family protein [Kitasatospora sp. P5_F3]
MYAVTTAPVGIDLNAPVITRDDIVIHAPLDRVWRIQTDVENWPSWQPDVTSVAKQTPGRLRPGSSWVWSVEGLEGITSTVEQVEPNRRIVWGGPAQGITAVHVWTFTPTRDGVRVHTEESWAGEPVSANVEMLQQALDSSLDHWLRNLKERAERGA